MNTTTKTFGRTCMSGTERANWLEHHKSRDYSGRVIVLVMVATALIWWLK